MKSTANINKALLLVCVLFLSGCKGNLLKWDNTKEMDEVLEEGVIDEISSNDLEVPDYIQDEVLDASVDSFFNNDSETDKYFDVKAKEVDARSFFLSLVSNSKHSAVISPSVTGVITIDLKHVTLEQALDAVTEIYDYSWRKTNAGYLISAAELQTRVFKFNYPAMQRQESSSLAVSGSGGSGDTGGASSVSSSSSSDIWKEVQSTLSLMLSAKDNETLSVNPQVGTIIVKALPKTLKNIEGYLAEVKRESSRQVILEAKILEVKLNKTYQHGIDWNNLAFNKLFADRASGANVQGSGVVSFGMRDGTKSTDFNSVIKLLDEQGDVQTLSSPRVSTLNNQRAIIKVGEDDYFVTGLGSTETEKTTDGDSSTSKTTDSKATFQQFFQGLSLSVIPSIEDDEIILHVHPAITTITPQDKEIDGSKYSFAQVRVKETDSIIKAKNGQVVVIGGLMENNISNDYSGSLLKNVRKSASKTELIILIKPIVVEDKEFSNDIARTKKKLQTLKEEYTGKGKKDMVFKKRQARMLEKA